ncbi:MAG: glycosyltransferase family 4 protein [Pseudomonas sp.]|nr:glycosyltransferase family 4 protein [Pseudomonas sp.]
MRVAFILPPGDSWTGGINYLDNLLSVFSENPEIGVTPVLFFSPETNPAHVQRLGRHSPVEPILIKPIATGLLQRLRQLSVSALVLKNRHLEPIFLENNIDLVFQSSFWCGKRFAIPTLCWLPDFQHKYLPHFFTRKGLLKRELGYRLMTFESSCVLVSSQTAKNDCERFYPSSRSKLQVLPFRVRPPEPASSEQVSEVLANYKIDRPYFYLPNQLWKHKNHDVVLRALKSVLEQDPKSRVLIVATGGAEDPRNPEHPEMILSYIKEYGLEGHFAFLGLVPYEHVTLLMQGADYMINPSLFEGWSTTVEEARSLGKKMLLSDLAIHREQVGNEAKYFNPHDASQLRDLLISASKQKTDATDTKAAVGRYRVLRSEFAQQVAHIFTRAAREPS